MPTYEYRCNACKRKVRLTTKTYAEYDSLVPTCNFCNSTDLTRLISRVGIQRSVVSRMMSGSMDDDSALDGLDDSDPRTLGRFLREMSAETGEDMGGEFDEVVTRLERGESPEDIEATMPDLGADDPGGGLGGAMGGSPMLGGLGDDL